MREIDYKKCQEIELDILLFFRDLCNSNGLTYYLTYGTLIGAIRHEGFIPWDDDIDVFMPREDYLKLVKIMQVQPNKRFKLIAHEVVDDFEATLPKIIDTRTKLTQDYGYKEYSGLGVYIDIFILDGVGDSIEDARSHYKASYASFRRWSRASTKMFISNRNKAKTLLQWIRNIPYKIKGPKYYVEEQSKINQAYSFSECKFVSDMTIGMNCGDDYIWPREIFSNVVLKKFEGHEFAVPSGYDYLLKKVYGDYMILPPKEKQVSHHQYVATWISEED